MASKGSRTRQQIVDTSLQLFSVKGYFHTSISDILRATGLTKGGLYGHFGSKEEIWAAAYEKAVEVWRTIVFEGVSEIQNPLERIAKTIENDLKHYVGGGTFAGGCFFFNMLVELSGQSDPMSLRILQGFRDFAGLLASWLREASGKGLLRSGLDHGEAADFIVIVLNGAAALYAATRDPRILEQTARQLRQYLDQMKTNSGRVDAGDAGPIPRQADSSTRRLSRREA